MDFLFALHDGLNEYGETRRCSCVFCHPY